MFVVLSTIGIGKYEEIEYCWLHGGGGYQIYRTALFPLAADAFFRPDKLLLMVTPEAHVHEHYREIERLLGNRLQPVPIPLGRTEDELWEIFDIVSGAVPDGARVVLDVTHALRSLPFVIFGVINYLRQTRDIHLERIIYGAYDAREAGPDGGWRAPVFDLTMLVDLHEWLQAVEAFIVRSEGEKLADLLMEAHRRQWISERREGEELPRQLQKMAGCIKVFSRSVRLLRPLEALSAAAKAQILGREVEREAARWAKPFGHILARLTDELTPLSAADTQMLDEGGLRCQLFLIKYFLEKDLIVQAVLMEREWLVNWLAWRAGFGDQWLNLKVRKKLESAMGVAVQKLKREKPTEESLPSWYSHLTEVDEIAELWDHLTALRNDVAHCAMNDSPASPESISNRAKEMVQKLEQMLSTVS